MMLPTIAITVHSSEKRPNGHEYLKNLLNSIVVNKKLIRNVVIVDNQSSPPVESCEYIKNISSDIKIKLVRIENQFEKGLTGAWNVAIKNSFETGAEFVINCNDDLLIHESIKNFTSWANTNKNAFVCGPITDDEGTGDKLRKLSNTKYGNFQAINDQYPKINEHAKKVWKQANERGEEVIDALSYYLPELTPAPWLNGFCFALNKKAYQKIIDFRSGHEDALFTVGHVNKKNLDEFGIIKSKWGGQEYSFVAWKEKLGIELKVIGNWYVPHVKDKNNLWRVHQNAKK